MNINFVHVNIISRDWKKLAEFYINVFDCKPLWPERDLNGKWLDDATGIENVKPGDEVEVFGDNIQVDELAKISGNINYEVLTGIGPRVPRIFYKDGNAYMEKNILAKANGRVNNE